MGLLEGRKAPEGEHFVLVGDILVYIWAGTYSTDDHVGIFVEVKGRADDTSPITNQWPSNDGLEVYFT